MTRKFTHLKEHNISLPSEMFCPPIPKSRIKSPVAGLNPSAAIYGSGFQSSTPPSEGINKKTIVIDKSSFYESLDNGKQIAFIAKLKLLGFAVKIYVGGTEERFVEVDDNLENIVTSHWRMMDFEEFGNEDYDGVGESQENILHLSVTTTNKILDCFDENPYLNPNAHINEWQCVSRVLTTEEVGYYSPKKRDAFLRYFDQQAFLDYVTFIKESIKDQTGIYKKAIEQIKYSPKTAIELFFAIHQTLSFTEEQLINFISEIPKNYVSEFLADERMPEKSTFLELIKKVNLVDSSEELSQELIDEITNFVSRPPETIKNKYIKCLLKVLPERCEFFLEHDFFDFSSFKDEEIYYVLKCLPEDRELYKKFFDVLKVNHPLSRLFYDLWIHNDVNILSNLPSELFSKALVENDRYSAYCINLLHKKDSSAKLLDELDELSKKLNRKEFAKFVTILIQTNIELILDHPELFNRFIDLDISLPFNGKPKYKIDLSKNQNLETIKKLYLGNLIKIISFIQNEEHRFELIKYEITYGGEHKDDNQFFERVLMFIPNLPNFGLKLLKIPKLIEFLKGLTTEELISGGEKERLLHHIVNLLCNLPKHELRTIVELKLINDDIFEAFWIAKVYNDLEIDVLLPNDFLPISPETFFIGNEELREKQITHLYIANLNSQKALDDALDKLKQLPNLVSIEIPNANLEFLQTFISKAETGLNIKYLTLPIQMLDKIKTPIPCIFIDYVEKLKFSEHKKADYDEDHHYNLYQYWLGITRPQRNKNRPKKDSGTRSAPSSSSDPTNPNPRQESQVQTPTIAKEEPKPIFVAHGRLRPNMTTSMTTDTQYTLVKAGMALKSVKDDEELRLRTGIVKCDLKSLTQEFRQGEDVIYDVVANVFLSEDELRTLSNPEDKTHEILCHFNHSLTANQRTRLLSISPNDTFCGLVGNFEGITIERGDDDFYYATSTISQTIQYAIGSASVLKYSLDLNDIDSKIKAVIDQYLTNINTAEQNETPFPQLEQGEESEWLDKLYETGTGACRHRVLAVVNKLRTAEIDEKLFRMCRIDNNHILLEIKIDDKWCRVELGGAPAILNYTTGVTYSGGGKQQQQKPKKAPIIEEQIELEDQENKPQDQPYYEQTVTQKTLEKSENYEKLEEHLQSTLKPREIIEEESGKQALIDKTLSNSDPKILLLVPPSTIDAHSNFLISEARKTERPVFYIDNPDKIDIGKTIVFIDQNSSSQAKFRKTGLLQDFLSNSKTDPKPLLIINWQNFSDGQRAALNTIIDENKRRVSGVDINNAVQIIGLCSKSPKDTSFLSRQYFVESKLESDALKLTTSPTTKNVINIDLEGLSDWRAALFGKVVVKDKQMVWQQSEFSQALLAGHNNFTIANISFNGKPSPLDQLKYEIEQAKALGEFVYNGFKIKIPDGFKVSFNRKSFDFEKFITTHQGNFSPINVVNFDQQFPIGNPQDLHLINTQLFDQLLHGKEVENGNYLEPAGLLEEHKGGNLNLFISSSLSDNQWYGLFYNAQKHQVKLTLNLAPNVSLPRELGIKKPEEQQSQQKVDQQDEPTIFVANNSVEQLSKISQLIGDAIVIDVEDYGYEDLVSQINYEIKEEEFSNFQKIKSDLLEKLENSQNVVLKGDFHPDLLRVLEPLIIKQSPEFSKIRGKLFLVIEDQSLSKSNVKSGLYAPLSWLPKNCYQLSDFAPLKLKNQQPYQEPESAPSNLDFDTKKQSDEFIERRKSLVATFLKNNPMLQLVGHSGVGKSRLMKEFEDDQFSPYQIYREMGDFEKWAQQGEAEEKIPVLFIDESNMEKFQFTKFSPLKEGGTKEILHNGKLYKLTDQHKVVFACNPVSLGYRADRVESQKLFDDGSIPSMFLADFPDYYIYEQILKAGVYDGLDDESKKKIPEEKFKQECVERIRNYQRTNSHPDPKNHLTVRELQEELLVYLSDELKKPRSQLEKTDNFIQTSATKNAERKLGSFLGIRQKQKDRVFGANIIGSGLNGVLLEGASGVGKSEMIRAMFQSDRIAEVSIEELMDVNNEKDGYVKIDASMASDLDDNKLIKEIITKAFETGRIVWIDEINTIRGLEKILNSVLTDQHPNGSKALPKAGFALVSSINDVSEAGRVKLSNAVLHRLVQVRMLNLQQYSEHDLAKIIAHWINVDKNLQTKIGAKNGQLNDKQKEIIQKIAVDFKIALKDPKNKGFNLRSLKDFLSKGISIYFGEVVEEELPIIESTQAPTIETKKSRYAPTTRTQANKTRTTKLGQQQIPTKPNAREPLTPQTNKPTVATSRINRPVVSTTQSRIVSAPIPRKPRTKTPAPAAPTSSTTNNNSISRLATQRPKPPVTPKAQTALPATTLRQGLTTQQNRTTIVEPTRTSLITPRAPKKYAPAAENKTKMTKPLLSSRARRNLPATIPNQTPRTLSKAEPSKSTALPTTRASTKPTIIKTPPAPITIGNMPARLTTRSQPLLTRNSESHKQGSKQNNNGDNIVFVAQPSPSTPRAPRAPSRAPRAPTNITYKNSRLIPITTRVTQTTLKINEQRPVAYIADNSDDSENEFPSHSPRKPTQQDCNKMGNRSRLIPDNSNGANTKS